MRGAIWAAKTTAALFAASAAAFAVVLTAVHLGGFFGLIVVAVLLVFGILWFSAPDQ